MKKKTILCGAAIGTMAFCGSASADILAEWDGVEGTTIPANDVATGLTGMDLSRGPGIAEATGSNFNSNGFDDTALDFDDAIAADDYLSFGFTVDSGTVDLTTILVELDRSSTGPATVGLFSSVDGFDDASDLIQSFSVSTSGTILTFDVSSLTGLTGTVEFRFYFFGATSTLGTADIEDDLIDADATGLQINGTIPAPGALALLGIAGLAGARRRRRA